MTDLTYTSALQGLVGIIAQRPLEWKTAARDLWLSLGYNRALDPMSLVQAENLSKAYGDQDVLTGVTFSLARQTRVALVGPNGVGKTTILRLIAGREKPDQGVVQRARGLQIGYLPQEATYSQLLKGQGGRSLWSYCLDAFEALRRMQDQLGELEAMMNDPKQVEEALTRYGALQERFEREGGYTYQVRVRQVLHGLGFSSETFEQPLGQLSGGQRTRAHLARLLLDDPDLLILDEPTNHLDIEGIEWLEGWLHDWPGAALIVSHDRYFLDHVVEGVWELSPQGLEYYKGGYSDYVEQRAARRRLLEARVKARGALVRKERDFIARNIAGQKTRQAKGRRKRLERLLEEDPLSGPRRTRTAAIQFAEPSRSGEDVFQTKDLIIAHPGTGEALFHVPDLLLRRGERAALIGPNGAGKTTLLKTLLGELAPLQGSVRLGASLKIGYFEQAHAGLNPDHSVLQEVQSVAPDLGMARTRDLLGRFLFPGDAVQKPVRALSGGERGRLALLKLILEGANFLVLDEPTNHLDLPSREALERALQQYQGTVLLVSHDRYLIERIADRVWAISPDQARMTVHPDGYAGYLQARRKARAAEAAEKRDAPQRKQRARRRKKDALSLDRVEDRVAMLEAALSEVSEAIAAAGDDREEIRRLGERYAALDEELAHAMALWEQAARADPQV